MSLRTISEVGPLDATPAEGIADRASAVGRFLRRVVEVRRQRDALLALDDRMLADIGLGRSEAYGEATRSMLDLPSGRPSRR